MDYTVHTDGTVVEHIDYRSNEPRMTRYQLGKERVVETRLSLFGSHWVPESHEMATPDEFVSGFMANLDDHSLVATKEEKIALAVAVSQMLGRQAEVGAWIARIEDDPAAEDVAPEDEAYQDHWFSVLVMMYGVTVGPMCFVVSKEVLNLVEELLVKIWNAGDSYGTEEHCQFSGVPRCDAVNGGLLTVARILLEEGRYEAAGIQIDAIRSVYDVGRDLDEGEVQKVQDAVLEVVCSVFQDRLETAEQERLVRLLENAK